MQQVLIDTFVVPEESKAELLEAARSTIAFIKSLPGFIEGYIFEKVGGDGTHNVVTTAVWESEAAYKNAMQAALAEYQKTGWSPKEIMQRLGVRVERAIYSREPY